MSGFKFILLLVLSCFIGADTSAQMQLNKEIPIKTKILFLLDASGSMGNEWQGSTRWFAAKSVLSQILDSLQKVGNLEVGLRAYGSESGLNESNCKDTKLIAPIKASNADYIKAQLENINTRGITPIAYAMQQVVTDFGINSVNQRNILILITDGIESCQGNPCEVSLQLQKKGIMLNPYIIGIGMNKNEIKNFDCVGRFYDAGSPKAFLNYAQDIMEQIVNITTAEIQLMDDYGKASESDLPVTFYDHTTGKIRYNFIQTLNQRGKPDTLSIDPVSIYDIVIHSTPAVQLNQYTLKPDIHNVIKAKTPTGNLLVNIDGISEKFSFQSMVQPEQKDTLIAFLETGKPGRFLTGRYDVEVLCLPRISVNVEVAQSKTTTINIPAPGIYTMLNAASVPIVGSIYEEKGEELYWLTDVNGRLKSESIVLQPGNYRFIYRAKASKKMQSTRDIRFRIAPGASDTYKIVF